MVGRAVTRRLTQIVEPDWLVVRKLMIWPNSVNHARFSRFKILPRFVQVVRLVIALTFESTDTQWTDQCLKMNEVVPDLRAVSLPVGIAYD